MTGSARSFLHAIFSSSLSETNSETYNNFSKLVVTTMITSRAASKAFRLGRYHNQQRQILSPSPSLQWSWNYSGANDNNNNNKKNGLGAVSSCDFHSFALRRQQQQNDDDNKMNGTNMTLRTSSYSSSPLYYNYPTLPTQQQQQYQIRSFHSTAPSERAVALIMGLTTVSALAYAGASAVQSYNEWKAAQPSPEELEQQRKKEEEENAARAKAEEEQEAAGGGKKTTSNDNTDDADQPRKNVFKEWFGVGVGAKYYEGGFEDKMTKKEAALILGVRESSSAQRIKDAHRKLLILNHPDTGGSTYLSGKINEAKELLLKGKMKA